MPFGPVGTEGAELNCLGPVLVSARGPGGGSPKARFRRPYAAATFAEEEDEPVNEDWTGWNFAFTKSVTRGPDGGRRCLAPPTPLVFSEV